MPSTLPDLRQRLAATASGFKPPGDVIRFTNSSYADPCGVGTTANRFYNGKNGFPFYVGYDFETCFAEYFIRDTFDGKATRTLALSVLRSTNAVILEQTRLLTTVRVTKDLLLHNGLRRTILAANIHSASRSFAAGLAIEQPQIDSLLYESTNMSGKCMAVAKGAISAFEVRKIIRVADIPNLVGILSRLRVDINPTV